MAKIDKTGVDRQFKKLETAMRGLVKAAHTEFIKNTPVRSGNARRKTRLDGDRIVADYAYSQRLDEGYSKQAPEGMVRPTEEWIQQEVDRRLKDI